MSNYYRFNCAECNGVDLVWRGDALWDAKTNKWSFVEDSMNEAYCHNCDKEVTVKDNSFWSISK